MNELIKEVQTKVCELMGEDNSGHGISHILRVYDLAMKFAYDEKANKEIVALAALLHDVDDYKIVGKEASLKLVNAKNILNQLNVANNIQEKVLEIIRTMGYSKFLAGVRPTSLEGKIVSDADMCDAIGSNGIIRSVVYAVSGKGNGVIFDKNIYPDVQITKEKYNKNGTTHCTDSAINHFFEKLLKLSSLMMTESGKKESIDRQKIMIKFLKQFFKEENVPEWNIFLDKFLKEENKNNHTKIAKKN
jgi:uncharacterized protein